MPELVLSQDFEKLSTLKNNYQLRKAVTLSKSSRRMLLFLVLLAVASTVGFQAWRTLLNNFAVDVAGINGAEMGIIQSVREIPGFLALLVIYALLIIKEHRLAALSVAILGFGTALAGYMPTFAGLIFTTLVMSFGFHYYETLNQSLTLQYFGHTEAPLVFGRVRSIVAITNIVVGVSIFWAADHMSYQQMFLAAGVFTVAVALLCSTRDPRDSEVSPQHKEMVFRKKYWLFYALTFLSGGRRQIFVAFAVFLLVQKFGYSLTEVTALFMANNAINTIANPMIGRAVNRFGERTVLTVEYSALVIVFAGYAVTESALVAGALYILDNIFYNFSMAIKTFFQKIVDKPDIAPSMAVGFTINHIAAVAIPAMGGAIWLIGYRWVFWGAAAMSLVSLALAQLTTSQIRHAKVE